MIAPDVSPPGNVPTLLGEDWPRHGEVLESQVWGKVTRCTTQPANQPTNPTSQPNQSPAAHSLVTTSAKRVFLPGDATSQVIHFGQGLPSGYFKAADLPIDLGEHETGPSHG